MSLVLLLPGPEDLGAGEVATALRGRGHDVCVLSAADLEAATWEHRIDARGVSTRLAPAGREPIADPQVGAVLNRLGSPCVSRFARSTPKDRDYATAEWQALLVSWLQALGDRVVGGVDGQGPRAHHAALSWWQWAQWCGLGDTGVVTVPIPVVDRPVPQPHQGDLVRFVVIGERVLRQADGQWWPYDGPLISRIRALAVAGDADLLGVDLCLSPRRATLVGVDPRPTLRGAVADVVAELLASRAPRQGRLAS